jgi:NADH dehydrogenase (ubiquinone) 1 alpha subcomplex subunit 9
MKKFKNLVRNISSKLNNYSIRIASNKHSDYRVATVFGASGFLGRYIVQELARAGYQVIIPWRKEEYLVRHTQSMGVVGQIVNMRFHQDKFLTIEDICSRSNVVVNAAGRYFDKYGDTMELGNIKFAGDVAKVEFF